MVDYSTLLNDTTMNLVLGMGVSGLVGAVVGFAAKKILKFLMILTGIYVGSLMYLQYKGIITIDYDKLLKLFEDGFASLKSTYGYFATLAGALPIVGSFGIGFLLGFRKG